MHVRATRLLALATLLVSVAAPHRALAVEVPPLRARVNDRAGLLDASQGAALEEKLARYERETGHQFALLVIPSLEGEAIEPFAVRVFEAWKLGDARRDDGLLLVVALGDRRMRIEVGYGLEGAIPDAIAARVIREVLTPAFRAQDFAGGLDRAFDVLMAAGRGEAAGPALDSRASDPNASRGLDFGELALFLLLFVIFAFGTRSGRGRGGMPMTIGGMGGGFGGRGGGGFSGGGGRSGGGGASGSW